MPSPRSVSLPTNLFIVPKKLVARLSLPLAVDHSGKGGVPEEEAEEEEELPLRSRSLPAVFGVRPKPIQRGGSLPDPSALRRLDRSRPKKPKQELPRMWIDTGGAPRYGSLPPDLYAHLMARQRAEREQARRIGSLPDREALLRMDRSGGPAPPTIPEFEPVELPPRGASMPHAVGEYDFSTEGKGTERSPSIPAGSYQWGIRVPKMLGPDGNPLPTPQESEEQLEDTLAGFKQFSEKYDQDVKEAKYAAQLKKFMQMGYDPALRGTSLPEPMHAMGTIGPRGSWLHKAMEGKPEGEGKPAEGKTEGKKGSRTLTVEEDTDFRYVQLN